MEEGGAGVKRRMKKSRRDGFVLLLCIIIN